jgi:hypothetical protein
MIHGLKIRWTSSIIALKGTSLLPRKLSAERQKRAASRSESPGNFCWKTPRFERIGALLPVPPREKAPAAWSGALVD